MALINSGLVPAVPEQGSVGRERRPGAAEPHRAGADGRGDAGRRARRRSGAARGRDLRRSASHRRRASRFINGTQAQTAMLALLVHDAELLWRTAVGAAAMSLEALRGTPVPLDPRIHENRPAPGPDRGGRADARSCSRTARSASRTGRTTTGCRMPTASVARPRCSAPCSMRSGSSRGWRRIELNASTDNPLVFESGEVLSGGNFHGQPVAQALDFPGDRADDAAGHRRAAGGAAGQSRPLAGAAGLPHRQSRALVGLHDGADHRGVAGGRVAEHRHAGEHRLDSRPTPTRRTSSRWAWRRPSRRRRILRNARRGGRDGTALRGPGARVPEAAAARAGAWPTCTPGCRSPVGGVPPLGADRPPAPDLERLAARVLAGELAPSYLP